MADSFQSIDKRCVFRESFESEQSVRRNGGSPVAVTFNKGTGSFVKGSSSLIQYIKAVEFLKRTCCIRWIGTISAYGGSIFGGRGITNITTDWGVTITTLNSTSTYITVCYGTGGAEVAISSAYIPLNTKLEIVLNVISGVGFNIYVNGSLVTTFSYSVQEIRWSGYPLKIGSGYDSHTGTCELFEIYDIALSADEVKNLYENKRHKDLNVSRPEQLGAELINQSAWKTQAYWTAVGAHTQFSSNGIYADTIGEFILQKDSFWSPGVLYKVVLTLTGTGQVYAPYGGSDGTSYLATAPVINHTYYINQGNTSMYIYNSSSFIGTITALSIKQVIVPTTTKEILNVCSCDGVVRNKYSENVYGNNLIPDIGSRFTTGVGFWGAGACSVSWNSGGWMTVSNLGSGYIYDAYTLVIGKKYRMSFRVKASPALVGFALNMYWTSIGSNRVVSGVMGLEWRTFSGIVYGGSDTVLYLQIGSSEIGTIDIDDIEVQEIIPSVINTAVNVVKENDVQSMKFNGSTSKIDCGIYDTLVGDKTFVGWINLKKYDPAGSYIFQNGQFKIAVGAGNVIAMTSVSTWSPSASASVVLKLSVPYFVVCTRTSAGVGNIYINGVLSGTANQATGTPTAGTNIFIGNILTYYYNGLIPSVRIFDGILSAQEISQIYSSEKDLYGL